MVPNVSTVELRPVGRADDGGEPVGTDRARTRRDVERELLCRRIERLERELERERQRRRQVVQQYERQLRAARADAEPTADEGLLAVLF